MSLKIYYRTGKRNKKGVFVGSGATKGIEDYIAEDETRRAFEKRFRSDASFRRRLGWDKKSVDEYLKEWKERAKTGGKYVQPRDHVNEKGQKDGQMCADLYELGEIVSEDEKTGKIKIRTLKNKVETFDPSETCVYDQSHDGPDIPDDVVSVQGFGEAAILKVMRRRISEKLNIYTYVGDVVLCLNPYMYIPAMVEIAEPPAQKNYKLGSNPTVYASAHFSYWGMFVHVLSISFPSLCLFNSLTLYKLQIFLTKNKKNIRPS